MIAAVTTGRRGSKPRRRWTSPQFPRFTAGSANFTGGDITIGPTSGTHLRALSGAWGVRNSSGDVLANVSSSGSDGVFSAPTGAVTVTANGNVTIASTTGKINLTPSTIVNFAYSWDTTARMDAGSYLPIQVNGTTRYVRLYS